MSDETMADRRYRMLEPDRSVELEQMRAKLVELGDTASLKTLGKMERGFDRFDKGKHGDPMKGLLMTISEEVRSAMRDLGADTDKLESARVGSTLREEVSAQLTPFSDGSGLAMISDAVLSLAFLYCQYAGVVTRSKAAWFRRGTTARDESLLIGLLRYYNVNQRVFGLAGKLGWRTSRRAMLTSYLVGMNAARFIVAHELSHHVLGHSSAPSGFSPGEHLPVCSDSQRLEMEADEFAFRTVRRAAGPFERSALTGALMAMLAIHSTEQALFVRRGVTHPAAATRASYLLQQVDPELQSYADNFIGTFLKATELSSDFSESAQPFEWEQYAAARDVTSSHPVDYLRTISLLDQLQCSPDQRLVDAVAKSALPIAGAGASYAGDVRRALATWGLGSEQIDSMLDPNRALTFHTLYEAIQASLMAQGMPPAERIGIPLAAARLVSDRVCTAR
ncbi:hypothetical protein EV645_3744 [Kribbella rubisoli]|uniref:IrrE N-terminal-like domain-containing protein n=1 Tax=Kribbella rubisoli TaxID=3075929 RepID=A0A4Q7X030_9ACTN|nr:hypothetical protein [Kribbella rubisoli]RZU16194.1 hypothetical protein EV645_3744 [Kribbella rubisoli]